MPRMPFAHRGRPGRARPRVPATLDAVLEEASDVRCPAHCGEDVPARSQPTWAWTRLPAWRRLRGGAGGAGTRAASWGRPRRVSMLSGLRPRPSPIAPPRPPAVYDRAVQGFVGNTDFDWFTFLRDRQPLEEVNFWQPSGGDAFRALAPGEPFFFRLKKPHYAIGGFGLFARHEVVPARLAWDAFGERNGAASLNEMCARIERYRHGQPTDPHRQYRVGCIMLSTPVLFEDGDWVREPAGFSRNIVRGAGYDLAEGEGRRVWEACLDRARAARVPLASEGDLEPALLDQVGPRYGAPRLVRPRLGQGTFQVAVTQAYGAACAVTGEHSLPVLDVAHIQGYAAGGPHEVRNGLLLRTDIHRLFDRGYVTVSPDLRFEVSARLREEFENGRTYYALHGKEIRPPRARADRPDPALLRWHNEQVFERAAGGT
jgi:putative restriction endonuclease